MWPWMVLSLAMMLFLLVGAGIAYFMFFSFVTGFGLDPKWRVHVKCRAYHCQLFAGGRTVTEGAWAVSTRNRGKSAIWVSVGKKSCITVHESVNIVLFGLRYNILSLGKAVEIILWHRDEITYLEGGFFVLVHFAAAFPGEHIFWEPFWISVKW